MESEGEGVVLMVNREQHKYKFLVLLETDDVVLSWSCGRRVFFNLLLTQEPVMKTTQHKQDNGKRNQTIMTSK